MKPTKIRERKKSRKKFQHIASVGGGGEKKGTEALSLTPKGVEKGRGNRRTKRITPGRSRKRGEGGQADISGTC